MRQAYFDNNATTPVDSMVVEAMMPFYLRHFGNASSVHRFGQKARAAVEEARQQVADLLGGKTREVVFTSGGTEADNLALRGVALSRRSRGDHIVTSRTEHPAILRMCETLERDGFRVTYLGATQDGMIHLPELLEAIEPRTILISIMLANNETGVLQPLEEISRISRERGIVFHTDAVQAIGKIPVNVEELGVDLLSLSAHKFHGPKGVGALFVRDGVEVSPMMLGGAHERNRRGGTENVPGIVGLGKACELARKELDLFHSRTAALRDLLEESILRGISGTRVNGSTSNRVPHVSNISFEAVHGESLLIALDLHGIAVSTGAACHSGSVSPSHVLVAMGLPRETVNSAIRFSLGRFNERKDVEYLLSVLPQVVARMREVSPHSQSYV